MTVSECRLIKGSIALAAQLTLAAGIASSLLYKRHRERPKRPLVIWGLDITKQGFSSTACHLINMSFALMAAHKEKEDDSGGASECSWYFVQYNFDNTLGVTLTILTHRALITLAQAYVHKSPVKNDQDNLSIFEIIANCGNYGMPPKVSRWLVQVIEWLGAVIFARSVTGCLVIVLANALLNPLAVFVDSVFHSQPILHLYFILVIYPMFCSTTVAWILDGLLKRNATATQTYTQIEEVDESAPLIVVSSE